MVNLLHIATILILIVDLPGLLTQQQPDNSFRVRNKRSIGNFFKRLFGRRKTGFQGTAQAQGAYNTQGSSYFPNYAYANLNPYQAAYDQAASGHYHSYGNYAPSASSYSPVAYGSLAQASGAYPSYAQAAPGYGQTAAGQTGGNVDFNSVLSHFVRSAGFGPAGDQEAAASNIQSKGDTPVFSFKKLYTFPFYLNTDSQEGQHGGYNFQIPFMKRHIRRMAQDYANRRTWKANQRLLKKLAKQNQRIVANQYPSSYYNNYDPRVWAQYVDSLSRPVEVPAVAESAGKATYYVGPQPMEKSDMEASSIGLEESKVQGMGKQGVGAEKPAQHQSVSVKTSYSAA